jgi:hypothetical protein
MSLTVAVTVRVFHPLPYYLEHLVQAPGNHAKNLQEARKLARPHRAVNFGFQEIFTLKFHFKSGQSAKKCLSCLEKRRSMYFEC